jgi:hypothetical protein
MKNVKIQKNKRKSFMFHLTLIFKCIKKLQMYIHILNIMTEFMKIIRIGCEMKEMNLFIRARIEMTDL